MAKFYDAFKRADPAHALIAVCLSREVLTETDRPASGTMGPPRTR
jgi:hypothetical protein